jgi:hypothetical protein
VPHKFLVAANARRIRKFPARGARGFATLNHYALRSLDSYLVKNDRGDVNRDGRVFDDTYWRERNDPAWEDRSILRYRQALRASLAEMKADRAIGPLHAEACHRHRTRRDALLSQPAYAAMAAHLKALPPLPPGEPELLQALGLRA